MQRNKKRLALYFLLMLAVMIIIFCFSSQNAEESKDLSNSFSVSFLGKILDRILPRLYSENFSTDIRKYAHMFEYLCLGLSSALFSHELFCNNSVVSSLCAEAICVLYSASDEWHQTFVPGRSGQFSDVIVDSYGFTTGVLLITVIIFLMIKRKGRE